MLIIECEHPSQNHSPARANAERPNWRGDTKGIKKNVRHSQSSRPGHTENMAQVEN